MLFPQLERLELKTREEGLSAAMAAEILLHHAPGIKRLGNVNSWHFDWDVEEKMQDLEYQDEARSLVELLLSKDLDLEE